MHFKQRSGSKAKLDDDTVTFPQGYYQNNAATSIFLNAIKNQEYCTHYKIRNTEWHLSENN